MKKFIALLTCLLLSFSTFNTYAYEHNDDTYHANINTSVTYSINGGVIHEETTIVTSNEIIKSDKYVNVDGSFTVKIVDSTDEFTINGQTNYNDFLRIATGYILNQYNISPFGSDITGSNYKHVYIGDVGPEILNSKVLQDISSIASAYSVLAGLFPALPGGPIAELASMLCDIMYANSPEKCVISTTSYEIHFSYDDVYYTHCYHHKIVATSGFTTDTYTDYSQSYGG